MEGDRRTRPYVTGPRATGGRAEYGVEVAGTWEREVERGTLWPCERRRVWRHSVTTSVAFFHDFGFLIFRQLLGADEVETIAREAAVAIEEIYQGLGRRLPGQVGAAPASVDPVGL